MSKVMRSGKPASRPTARPPTTPGARAGQHGAHRLPRGRLEADHAAVALGDVRRDRDPERRAGAGRAARYSRASPARDRRSPRRSRGARTRGTPARPRARRRRRPRGTPRRRCASPPPRARIDEAVEEARPRPPDARGLERAGGRAHLVLVERRLDAAVVAQPLADLEAQVAGDEQRRLVGLQVVEIRPVLAADLEQVAEALGGDEAGRDAAVLDQRVGGDRGAVAEIGDLGRRGLRRRARPSSTPRAMARDGSSGVEGTFHTSTPPLASSNRQTSVKVPPESTPIRQAMNVASPAVGAAARQGACSTSRPQGCERPELNRATRPPAYSPRRSWCRPADS